MIEIIDPEKWKAAIIALATLTGVLGWHLGTRKSISKLNPPWLKEGFWGRYLPSLPSKNKWGEEVISTVQLVIAIWLAVLLVYPGYALLVLAMASFENLSGARFDQWTLIKDDPVFTLMPVAIFALTYFASILNMCLHDLRYSLIVRRQGDQANTSATLPTDKTHQEPI